MMKKEKFNIEDSNVAGLGSDLDKQLRQDAAATELAWKGAGKAPGLQIWRIEKFKVKKSQTPAGTFYSDDSYICLNTYKCKDENGNDTDKLGWDIHFWLGQTTSQDEAGTAAYKTVELDDLLGGAPVQHREVQGHESSLFLSYFKSTGGIKLLEGGIESGFNHVTPETYKPRLLHLKGKKNIRIEEVEINFGSLNSGDVFVLDNGLDIYQWQGKSCGKNEKARAGQLCRAMDDERKGKPEVYVISQGDSDEKDFFRYFPGYDESAPPTIKDGEADDAEWEKDIEQRVYKLSDASGSLEFTKVSDGPIKKSMLSSDDVFIVDIGSEVFAWVGKNASKAERRGAMQAAQDYLKKEKRPTFLPISKVLEGGENEVFKGAVGN